MIMNDICSKLWNKNSYLGAWQQINVFARERRITSTGIVFYKFFKRSLHCSHQRRHSEVPCASFVALWALLCCTASNEGALNGSVNKKKMKNKKSQRLLDEYARFLCNSTLQSEIKLCNVMRDCKRESKSNIGGRERTKMGEPHAQNIPGVLGS